MAQAQTPIFGPGGATSAQMAAIATALGGNKNQVEAARATGSDYKPSTTTYTPTIVTDSNSRERIPGMINTATSLGATDNPTSNTSNSQTSNTDYASLFQQNLDKLNALPEDKDITEIKNKISAMKSNADSMYAGMLDSISGQYSYQRDLLRQSQASSTKSISNALMLGGGSRYAPISSQGVLNAKTQQDIAQLERLDQAERNAKLNVVNAQKNADYQLMEQELNVLKEVKNQKMTKAKEITDNMMKVNETLNKQIIQSSRDDAVVDLVTQGITDPKELLNTLNYNDKGEKVGDFTLKEISDTLKNISPDGDIKSLSGSVKDFFILKENGTLPSSISSLEEDQQLAAWLKYNKSLSSTPAKTTNVTSGGLTISKEDLTEGANHLNSVKGSDGYVDPYVYKDMAELWTKKGGLIQDFIKYYPPKYYVNPAASSILPTYLRNDSGNNNASSSNSSTSTDNTIDNIVNNI